MEKRFEPIKLVVPVKYALTELLQEIIGFEPQTLIYDSLQFFDTDSIEALKEKYYRLFFILSWLLNQQ